MYKANKYFPKSVKVLGITIQIEHKDIEELGLYGDSKITLRESYSSKELAYNTLIHEIIHATLERLGIQLSLPIEEVIAESIGNVLSENFEVKPKKF